MRTLKMRTVLIFKAFKDHTMLETLLITFREGLEAFLIVAIMLAYIKKTGRGNLITPIYCGTVVALFISATTGYHIRELAQDPRMEGILALIAGVLVASLTVFVMKNARHIRQQINDRVEKHASQQGVIAEIGIFLFTVLMISREGMETALMLGGISAYTDGASLLAGAAGGLVLVALIGFAWIRQSKNINLRLFMQVTGVFLVLFSCQLFLYGIHELSETGALPFGDEMNMAIHTNTERFETSQPIGQIIIYSLLVVPCAWLLFSYTREKFGPKKAVGAAE
jgi:high-affinity iron transporter